MPPIDTPGKKLLSAPPHDGTGWLLGELKKEFEHLGASVFQKKIPCLCLVSVTSSDPESHSFEIQTVEHVIEPHSEEDRTSKISLHSPKPLCVSDGRAYPIFKSDRNAFSARITLGRSKNNDIIIRSAMVSKLHAYFSKGSEDWQLTDMGSTNGSWVNNSRLRKNVPFTVHEEDSIHFGPHLFLLVGPSRFFELLKSLG